MWASEQIQPSSHFHISCFSIYFIRKEICVEFKFAGTVDACNLILLLLKICTLDDNLKSFYGYFMLVCIIKV